MFMKGFLLILSLITIGCSDVLPQQEAEIEVIGITNFGSIVVGESIKAQITLNNSTGEILEADNDFTSEVIVDPKTSGCFLSNIPERTKCVFDITVRPLTEGPKSFSLAFRNSVVTFSGSAVGGSSLVLSTNNISFGTQQAGDESIHPVTVTNLGGVAAGIPEISLPTGVDIESTTCINNIQPLSGCVFNFRVEPTLAGIYISPITFTIGATILTVTVIGTVEPGEPSGIIQAGTGALSGFSVVSPPTNVSTFVVTDAFGNTVTNGTVVTINVYPNSLRVNGQTTSTATTSSGIATFQLSSTGTSGYAAFSMSSGGAYGLYEFNINP